MNARIGVNRALARSFDVAAGSSNTLQSRGREHPEALRSSLIEATVVAIAGGSDPRLAGTLAGP